MKLPLLFLGLLCCTCARAGDLDRYNVVWDSPSKDSFGSMPLGNGDVGANVWVEPNGDLLFYVSKVDAFDAGHLLPKLGRVRVRFSPALTVNDFQQTLVLREGAIAIRAGDVNLRVWVDADSPVIRVTGTSQKPVGVVASFETLRPCSEQDDKADRLAWGYRNMSSAWIEHLRAQNTPEFAAKVVDPIMNRTSGCRLRGAGLTRDGKRALRAKATREVDLKVRVLSSQTATLPEWFAELEKPVASDWAGHQKWWQAFWDRSHIFVGKCGDGPVHLNQCRFTQVPQGSKAYEGHKEIGGAENAFQLSQRYALERFCEAAASRGAVPPPYNGSIFTMDMPAGVQGFNGPMPHPVSADARDWAVLSFMWQNTRHPYWSMAARGDYDTLEPGMKFVRGGLDVCRDHCKRLLGIDGAFIMEASWWHNVGVFNWDGMPGHLRYHQLATIELPAIMAEACEHTRDRKFLDEVLLPCAEAGIDYYANRFPKRDANGKMLMEGVGCVETYQGVTNPCTEIGCLKFLLAKLLSFEIDDARRSKWGKLLSEMPPVPTRRIRGLDLLAVGDRYDAGREICETPELYSVYPFRQAWLGTPERLAMARQSFHVRTISLDGTDDKQAVETGGWQAAPVQAAYLGLAREAARLTSINFNDQFIHWHDNIDPSAPFPVHPRPRFPAFWECKMDGTPDNDHGANSVNALQSMLLQSDGRKTYLLPAWPEDWDVSFKLRASGSTTVECDYRAGRVQSLKVTPESRRADIVDMSTPERRIQTLIEVACADRNYLFDLPPMLDALPKPGKTTGPWLEKYGESVTGVRAGPRPGCVFRDNIVYVHGSQANPTIPARLISTKQLSGTIRKLEYDQPIEPFALAAPSHGSLTAGKTGTTVDLGKPATIDRLEFTIDNPGHRRGQGKQFELRVREPNGAWRTIHAGHVFGCIYSKGFLPVTAQHIRLNIDAPVRQFDLFGRVSSGPASQQALRPVNSYLVLVDNRTYADATLRGKLDLYFQNVKRLFGLSATVVEVAPFTPTAPGENIASIRSIIKRRYDEQHIGGAILLGQIPYMIWRQAAGGNWVNFGPEDFYYADLEGEFQDRETRHGNGNSDILRPPGHAGHALDNQLVSGREHSPDGQYDTYIRGPQEAPAIWVSRIYAPTGRQYCDFFDKANAYYRDIIQQLKANPSATVVPYKDILYTGHPNYLPSASSDKYQFFEKFVKSLAGARFVVFGEHEGGTVPELFTRYNTGTYLFAEVDGHADPYYHHLKDGEYSVADVQRRLAQGHGALIQALWGCHSGDFTCINSGRVNLTFAYLLSPGITQAAYGCSWTSGTEETEQEILKHMAQGDCLGAAFQKMQRRLYSKAYMEKFFANEARHVPNHFLPANAAHKEKMEVLMTKLLRGYNLVGNPFVKIAYSE